MSAEPPPPDWVRSHAAFHHRRSILDGEDAGRTRSLPRVTLEKVARASMLGDSRTSPAGLWRGRAAAMGTSSDPPDARFVSTVRREWENLAFTTLRRDQLVAVLGFVIVVALAVLGWQRGSLSGMAAELSGERLGDAAPAAPRLSSDQVAWTDVADQDVQDGRRSTASFASDRGFADPAGDDPASGAKLFVADGRKSSKKVATSSTDDRSTGRDASKVAAAGAAGGDSPDGGSTTRPRTEPTTVAAVRYESCAEAAAAGATPIRLGEPGYRLSLDRDRDGVACENGSTPEDPGDGPVDSLYSITTTTTSGGSTTSASSTGAGTTSTVESTTTSPSSTTGSTTTTTRPTSTASTTATTAATTSTAPTTASTAATVSTTTTSTTSSTTTTTRPPTTSSTTTTIPTTPPPTPSTVSTTTESPPVDPAGLSSGPI